MKSKLLTTIALSSIIGIQELTAQDGMQYEPIPTASFAKLRQVQGGGFLNPLLQFANNEKAIGLYQNPLAPSSMLEINNTPAYTPFPHPDFALGELFRR